MITDKSYNYYKGLVTFLDVLGWKGIYKNRDDAIDSLKEIISYGINVKESLEKEMCGTRKKKKASIKIISISDTIVILSNFEYKSGRKYKKIGPKDFIYNLYIHGKISKGLLKKGISNGILLRGATSIGEFNYEENILIGEAIDEAADWHEQTDWSGLVLTPKTEFYFKLLKKEYDIKENLPSFEEYVSKFWHEGYNIPMKPNNSKLNICLNWIDEDIKLTKKGNLIFSDVGSLTRDIASKYINTFNFIEHIKNKENS